MLVLILLESNEGASDFIADCPRAKKSATHEEPLVGDGGVNSELKKKRKKKKKVTKTEKMKKPTTPIPDPKDYLADPVESTLKKTGRDLVLKFIAIADVDLNQERGSNKYRTCIYLWIQIKPVFSGRFLDPDKCPNLRESYVKTITFTPTIQHCRMASIIGLCLRAKLKECLPLHYQVNYALK
ncbi:hypothetical protein YC2023_065883 [Brassica napus]